MRSKTASFDGLRSAGRSGVWCAAASASLTPGLVVAVGSLSEPGGGGGPLEELLESILIFSNDVLIPFLLGIGFLVFVFGVVRYFVVGGANEDAKASGRSLMVYAILAFVVIIIFWGAVNLIVASIGLEEEKLDTTGAAVPFAPGP